MTRRIGYSMISAAEADGKITPGKVRSGAGTRGAARAMRARQEGCLRAPASRTGPRSAARICGGTHRAPPGMRTPLTLARCARRCALPTVR